MTAFQAIADWNDDVPGVNAPHVPFWSRSDDSGTNQAELAYWAALSPANPQEGKAWYSKRNQGMGAILNAMRAAAAPGAYTLADNATWTFQSDIWTKGGVPFDLKVVAARKSSQWINDYSILEVVKARNPEGAADFSAWIRSPGAQSVIANYGKIAFPTEQLFYPNAGAY
jgi:ABC-type tungstate transport system permease subunit